MSTLKQMVLTHRSKIVGFLGILLIVVAIPFVIRVFEQKEETRQFPPNNNAPQQESKISTQAQTVLTLSPNPLIIQSDSTSSHILNLDIQTNQNKITAVQVEIAYDPKTVTNVDIFPGTFFTKPTILFKQIDSVRGRISYALGIPPTDEPVSGSGIVANISFTPSVKNQSTEFTFLSKTLVTSVGINESTLKSTKGTTVVLSP